MKPLNEPLKTFRLLLKEAKPKLDDPVEIILIGGAAALLSGAVSRVTEDIVRLLIRRVYGEDFDPKRNLPKPKGRP